MRTRVLWLVVMAVTSLGECVPFQGSKGKICGIPIAYTKLPAVACGLRQVDAARCSLAARPGAWARLARASIATAPGRGQVGQRIPKAASALRR
jgi:hypothetical protein